MQIPLSRRRHLHTNREEHLGSAIVRLVIARCSVDYLGRLTAHLPLATRLLLITADGSV
jgi:RecB family endonuclease NucS